MAKFYADPSFLTALYAAEPGTAAAAGWMTKHPESLPLAFTPFHRHEIRTAFRQKVFRGEITAEQKADAFREIESDLKSGVLLHVAIPWTEAFREAEVIADLIGEKKPVRSADLLHVGMARALKMTEFLTLDTRQKEIAAAAGLKSALG